MRTAAIELAPSQVLPESGYSAEDLITLGFVNSPDHLRLVEKTRAP